MKVNTPHCFVYGDNSHVSVTVTERTLLRRRLINLVSDLMWLLLVFMMPYLHNFYIIINSRLWGIIFRQYL